MKTPPDNLRKSTTLDDVAAYVGVSRMAVSVVLNGSRSGTRVSQAKRDLILAAAKELNYRPNLVARSLARSATHIFGFYSGFDYLDVRNPFIAEITAGLLEECSRCSRDLLLHTIFRGHNINNLYDELVSGKIDGLVIWAPNDDPLAALLRDSHLPVVSIVENIPPFPTVGVDDYAGAFEIGRYLFEQGHRSILYLTLKKPSGSRKRRLDAMEDAASQLGMEIRVIAEPNFETFVSAIQLPGASGIRPTAIACWNDIVANQALSFCRRAGFLVPDQIAITGFDGFRTVSDLDPRLTTVAAPWANVASTAINYLLEISKGNDVPPETVLPVQLVRGETA